MQISNKDLTQNILVVSHSGWIYRFIQLFRCKMDPLYKVDSINDPVSNCSIYVLNIQKPVRKSKLQYSISLTNDNLHLEMTDKQLNAKYGVHQERSTSMNSFTNTAPPDTGILLQS